VPNFLRVDLRPQVAEIIRSLPSDLKKSVRAAIDEIAINPACGEPLHGELDGLWQFRVRRFRIVYEVDRKARSLRGLAVAHRQDVYEKLAAQVKSTR
jgi:mRNA-degrading endonuclease RelE of RelBE toxin-antitoxin system